MTRVHTTHLPLRRVRSVKQISERPFHPKPAGLWYGIGRSWLDWCESEWPVRIAGSLLHYRLTLDESRLLRLTTAAEVRAFGDKYGLADAGDIPVGLNLWIDWPRVAEQYGGIEIAPYQWSCRLAPECTWYYGWDVASGCVWDAGLVTEVQEYTLELTSEEEMA